MKRTFLVKKNPTIEAQDNWLIMDSVSYTHLNELHRYSIADGIRDKNVLGFDPYKVLTFRDKDVRKVVAWEKARAATEEEAISDPKKAKIFYEYMAVSYTHL